MSTLLPPDFDSHVRESVKRFWNGRLRSEGVAQEGGRGAVIGGKNLEGFADLIRNVALYSGIPDENIQVSGNAALTIPGYFRPTKMWDAIVVYKNRLVAAFELKSQVGPSFGNNFNNRSEESIGSALDFWTAHREKAFSPDATSTVLAGNDAKPPFLGYLMLLEECAISTTEVKVAETHFKVFPEFVRSSYAKRYELLVERLISEKLYSSACLLLSNQETGTASGDFSSPKATLGPRSLFADFAASLMAANETYR